MLYWLLTAFAALIVVLDQVSKWLVVQNIPLYETVPFLPGLLHFTYVRNTGMAFSLLAGGRWFFLAVTVAALVMIVVAVRKQWVNHPVGLWALAAIAGGAVGNFIDRVRFGFVVDMIEVEFITFPVFNVADCFVVCGGIALVVYAFFFDKEEEK